MTSCSTTTEIVDAPVALDSVALSFSSTRMVRFKAWQCALRHLFRRGVRQSARSHSQARALERAHEAVERLRPHYRPMLLQQPQCFLLGSRLRMQRSRRQQPLCSLRWPRREGTRWVPHHTRKLRDHHRIDCVLDEGSLHANFTIAETARKVVSPRQHLGEI